MTILYFIVFLGILVFVHELGHFLVAKLVGVRVEAFSIGYPPRLFGFKKGDTDYCISAIPLGGYCKMAGQDDEDEGEKSNDPGMFYNKTVWQRMAIVFAGPIMNILLCILLMPAVFMIGREQPAYLNQVPQIVDVMKKSPAYEAGLKKNDLIVSINDSEVENWADVSNKILISAKDTLHFTIKRDNEILNKDINVVSIGGSVGGFIGINPTIFYKSEAIVEDVEENGPAFKSDLQKGDKIIMINGEKVISWEYMLHAIALNQGEAMKFTIQRGGAIVSRYISPTFNEDLKRWTIGILGRPTESMVPMELVKYGFADAFKMGLKETYKITSMVGEVLGRLVTFQLSYRALGGPILIAKTSMAAAKLGLVPFLYFMAFMSIQLGILNLLPIPVLDGGHIVFLTIEKIIRKPLNIKVRAVANYIGLAVLLSLIVMITWNDLDRFWGIGKLVTNLFN